MVPAGSGLWGKFEWRHFEKPIILICWFIIFLELLWYTKHNVAQIVRLFAQLLDADLPLFLYLLFTKLVACTAGLSAKPIKPRKTTSSCLTSPVMQRKRKLLFSDYPVGYTPPLSWIKMLDAFKNILPKNKSKSAPPPPPPKEEPKANWFLTFNGKLFISFCVLNLVLLCSFIFFMYSMAITDSEAEVQAIMSGEIKTTTQLATFVMHSVKSFFSV